VLQEVGSQIKPGAPLAWSIRNANGKLLLARGHRVVDAQMLEQLLTRGMFVDASEMRTARGQSVNTPIVACLTNRNGDPLSQHLKRDTAQKESAIVALVPDSDVLVRVRLESLYADD
jgi:hypothetical protein